MHGKKGFVMNHKMIQRLFKKFLMDTEARKLLKGVVFVDYAVAIEFIS